MKALRCAALALAVVGLSAQGAEMTNAWWEVDFTSPTPREDTWPEGYGNVTFEEGTLGPLTNNNSLSASLTQPYITGIWKMKDGDESYITNSFNATNSFGGDACIKLDTQGNDLTWSVAETNQMEEGRKALVDADLYLVGSDSEPTEFDTGDVQTAIYLKNETDDGEGGTGETTNSVLCVYIFDPLLGNSGENTWRELDGVELKDNSWAHVQVIVDHSDDDNNPPTVQVFVNGTPMHARGGDATSWTAANGSDSQFAGRVSSVSFRGTGAVDNFVGQTVKKTVEKFDFVAEVFMDNTLVPQGQAGNVSRTELAVPVGPTEHADFLGFSFHDYEQDVKDATFVLKRIEFINQGNGEVTAIDYSYQNHQMLPTNSPAVFFEKEDITETDEETGDDIVVGERQTGTFNVLAPTAGATSNSVIARIYFQTFGANNAQAVTDLAGAVTTNDTVLLPATAGGTYPTNLVWTFDAVKGDNILTNLVVSNGAEYVDYANGKATVKVDLDAALDADTVFVTASYVAGALADGQDLRPTTNGNEIVFAPYTPPVAVIGVAEYPSLRAAVLAATAGDTIVLLRDDTASFTVDDPVVVIDKAVTIDGGSNKVYGVSAYDFSNLGIRHAFRVTGSGDVTIKDLTLTEFGGSAPTVQYYTYPIWTLLDYTGTITLDSVTVEKFARSAFNFIGGSFVVKNCTIDGYGDDPGCPETYFQDGINIYDATGWVSNTVMTGLGSANTDESSCFTLMNTGSLTVYDGTYGSDYVVGLFAGQAATLDIRGGSFVATKCDSGATSIFNGETNGLTATISGGWFTLAPEDDFIADGYKAVADESGPAGTHCRVVPDAVTYDITFNDADGTFIATTNVAAGATDYAPADPTPAAGFAFAGWTNALDAADTTVYTALTMPAAAANATYAAKYEVAAVEPPQVDAGTGLEQYKADPAHAGETVPEPFEFVEVDNTNKAQIAFVAPEAGTYVLYSCTTVDGQYEEDSGSAKLVAKGALVKLVETTPATTGAKFFKIYWTAP